MVDKSLVLIDYQHASVRGEDSMRHAEGGVLLGGWVGILDLYRAGSWDGLGLSPLLLS